MVSKLDIKIFFSFSIYRIILAAFIQAVSVAIA